MRRMISEKLVQWINSLKNIIHQNDVTNTTELGGNAEVDGNLKVNSNVQSDVFESSTEVGGVKVMFAKFNPTGKEDNHFHLTNSTVKLDDSNGDSHTIDEIFAGGGTQLYKHEIESTTAGKKLIIYSLEQESMVDKLFSVLLNNNNHIVWFDNAASNAKGKLIKTGPALFYIEGTTIKSFYLDGVKSVTSDLVTPL